MKRVFMIILVVVLGLPLAGCGKDDTKKETDNKKSLSSTQQKNTKEEKTGTDTDEKSVMEADRLLFSAAKHLGSSEATVEFKTIQNLNIELPPEYYYQYGKHLYWTGNLAEAKNIIEKYLEKAGRKGQFYRDALEVKTSILKEEKRLSRFVSNGDDTVTDVETGLMWAANPPEKELLKQDAEEYCNNYQGGHHADWRLPTYEELVSLPDHRRSNKHGYQISKLINLSHFSCWTTTPYSCGWATFFFGSRGEKGHKSCLTKNDDTIALCVRVSNKK